MPKKKLIDHSKWHRDDVEPAGRAPNDVVEFLIRVGGKNIFGEPRYRMVLAQHVRQWAGGEWNEFPDDATLSERGGVDFDAVKFEVEDAKGNVKTGTKLVNICDASSKLLRTVVEVRREERYPHLKGWMLQKWYPCSHPAFGSREQWEAATLKGRPDISLLGPWPSMGEYEPCSLWQEDKSSNLLIENGEVTTLGVVGLCLKEIPPLRVLDKAICAAEDPALDSRSIGATAGERRRRRLNEWMAREQKRREERKQRNKQVIQDHMKPYWGSSVEAARLREKLAEKAGITTHVGA